MWSARTPSTRKATNNSLYSWRKIPDLQKCWSGIFPAHNVMKYAEIIILCMNNPTLFIQILWTIWYYLIKQRTAKTLNENTTSQWFHHCFSSSLPKAHGLPFRGLSDFISTRKSGYIFLLVIGPIYTKACQIATSQKAGFVHIFTHFVYSKILQKRVWLCCN